MGRRLIGLYELGFDQSLFPAFLMTFNFVIFQASGNNSFSSKEFNKARKFKRFPISRFISISGGMRSGPGALLGFFFSERSSSSIVIGGSKFREDGVVLVLLTSC